MYPPQPRPVSAPKLREPLWQRQDGEQDAEWSAFGAWVDSRDWHRVGALSGLGQPEVLELATRWAWHARTRAWDAEHELEGQTERKAHAGAVLAAREALPGLLRQASALASELLEFAHAEQAVHRDIAAKQAQGEPAGRMPYLSLREVLMMARVGQQAVRDLEKMARPIGVESADAGRAADGSWDFSKLPAEQLRSIQLARAAAKG